jgi:hypothetical protein
MVRAYFLVSSLTVIIRFVAGNQVYGPFPNNQFLSTSEVKFYVKKCMGRMSNGVRTSTWLGLSSGIFSCFAALAAVLRALCGKRF